jgi:hypothetical protein
MVYLKQRRLTLHRETEALLHHTAAAYMQEDDDEHTAAAQALWCAARDGRARDVQRLADDLGARNVGVDVPGNDPEHPVGRHSTPLAVACAERQHDCIHILLNAGANPLIDNTTTGNGSIMHAAIEANNHGVIRQMAACGVDPCILTGRCSLETLLNGDSSQYETALVLMDVGAEYERVRLAHAVSVSAQWSSW